MLALGLVFIVLPAYAIIYWELNTADFFVSVWILDNCARCEIRYLDLQTYDGRSGWVYLYVMPLFFFLTLWGTLRLISVYFSEWRTERRYVALVSPKLSVIAGFAVFGAFCIYVMAFINPELSTSRYRGAAIMLSGWLYPLLGTGSVIVVSACVTIFTVFVVKASLQRGRLYTARRG